MILPTIPLANYQAPHTSSAYVMSNSPMSTSPKGLERHLFQRERLIEIQDYHKSEAEAYAEQWRLAA